MFGPKNMFATPTKYTFTSTSPPLYPLTLLYFLFFHRSSNLINNSWLLFIVCISHLNMRSTRGGMFLLFSDTSITKYLDQSASQSEHIINICWMNGQGQYFLLLAKYSHFLLLFTISLAEMNRSPVPWLLPTNYSPGDLSLGDEEYRLLTLCALWA